MYLKLGVAIKWRWELRHNAIVGLPSEYASLLVFDGLRQRKSQLTKYTITYTNTKGRKNHTVLISKELYDSLPDDRKSLLFSDCYGTFRSALERTDIELPDRQRSHVLRHTFTIHYDAWKGHFCSATHPWSH